MWCRFCSFLVAFLAVASFALAADGNRLAYLDEPCDPYYPHLGFAKLTTPQWVGEEGVECVVTLAIDDMRDPAKYEAFFRPILERLKKIDGRAPLSIMTCSVKPDDPQLAAWLKEGLSLECHTVDHPCPLLAGGDFAKAKSTYERCVDLMASIPGNRPVAFRMPCCDSKNTPSPRFWTEIFNKATEKGNFLSLDSSVFCILTSKDKSLPKEITTNEAGEERFRRYVPFKSFVNTIEDYPYPYVIARQCWEFPCIVPSDWEAQFVQKPNNPDTVRDLKLALDAVVLKQGVFNLVFHPHGWIRAEQVVELIDHAVLKHGKKVKFLTFRECEKRLTKNLLLGEPLRNAKGAENGVCVLDLNGDGWMDALVGTSRTQATRVWLPKERKWSQQQSELELNEHLHFGILDKNGIASIVGPFDMLLHFTEGAWKKSKTDLDYAPADYRRFAVALRDLDGDGVCELIGRGVNSWDSKEGKFVKAGHSYYGFGSSDRSCQRYVDLNSDGRLDVVWSDGTHLGFSIVAKDGRNMMSNRGREDNRGYTIPSFEIDGTNAGVWMHSGHFWWQNEHTDKMPDGVNRMSFADVLKPFTDHVAKEEAKEAKAKLPPILIGAAKVDITPDYPVRLTGYAARKEETAEIGQRIWAKALAIGGEIECCGEGKAENPKSQISNSKSQISDSKPNSAAILLTVDNCGICEAITAEVRKQLAAKAGISPERVAICSSHTHSAPIANGFAPMMFGPPLPPEQQGRIDRYTKELTDKLVTVALEALKARRPGRLSLGHGTVGFAKNRRPVKDPAMGEGPVDRRLSLLVAKDEEGKLLAVLANYACHCTTLGSDGFNAIHGDWAGVAQAAIEADHPGAISLISIGCGADANPLPRGTLELVNKYGRELADEVKRLLTTELTPLDASALRCTLRHIDLPHDTLPTKEQLAEKAKQPGTPGYHAKFFLDKLDRGEELPKTVRYPIACWAFSDDLAMVFLGGEVVVDYSIRLRGLYDERRLWINAYANDVPCYIASERILREGGYEADSSMLYYARPTRLAPAVENQIIEAVREQVPKQFLTEEKKPPVANAPGSTPPVASAQGSPDFPLARSPAESMATITLKPGLKIELVASEPLIEDPVAFDWGPDGRLWVVEMHDYPDGLDGKGQPGGMVKVLTDTDGDCRYDTAKTFLSGVPFPTGIKVWRKGALITAAPLIFYAEDTDGDGVADKRETLYEGFGEGNQQHRVNGLRWGFDGWLYVGNGDSGGKIKSVKTGQVVDVSGRDLRIRPDTGELEAQSGQTQYGRCRDDWGNWFGGNNSNPMWHYVLDDHYLRRNPHFAPPPVRQNVSVTPGASRIYPTSRTLMRFNDLHTANHFTSACSPEIYRDTWLGDGYYGNAFICEPVHNLIHREIMEPDGVTFKSRRAPDEQESEFLASSDNWFRPVMIRTGPDGALWVADMYRFVIEHPKWIPAEWQKKLDLRAGDKLGRIYRIVRADQPSPKVPVLAGLDNGELMKRMLSPNGIVRDMVQQLVFEEPQRGVDVKALQGFRAAQKDANPAVRLQSLATLAMLIQLFEGKKDKESQDHAHTLRMWVQGWDELKDARPEVRRAAIRLAEECGDLQVLLRAGRQTLVDDPDFGVRMQLAYSLGSVKNQEGGQLLASLLSESGSQTQLQAAIFTSLSRDNSASVAQGVLQPATLRKLPSAVFQQFIRVLIPLDAQGQTGQLCNTLISEAEQGKPDALIALALLSTELQATESSLPKLADPKAYRRLIAVVENIIGSPQDQSTLRLKAAIQLFASAARTMPRSELPLLDLLAPRYDPSVQAEAAAALARSKDNSIGRRLLVRWSDRTPAVRSQLLDAIVARDAWATELLRAIEERELPAAEVDARGRTQLTSHKNEAIRTRAQKLFDIDPNADRAKVVVAHQDVLALKGDAAQGRAVFAKRCAQCHKLDDVGNVVGPDFAAIKDRSPQAMLAAVLDPNRAVEDRYVEYVVQLRDGRTFSGIVADETSVSLTLVGPENKRQTVLRKDLEGLKSLGRSLMAEGMEKDLTRQDLADVLAYVGGRAPPSKAFPGNEPATVKPNEKGELLLPAAAARIYGPSLVFEPTYKNLGYWSSPDDRAEWSAEVAKAGKYRVVLDFACDGPAAGDEIVVQLGGRSVRMKVPSTGSWDTYQRREIGTLDLPAGPLTVTARSADTIRQALIDLRGIRLLPGL